MKLLDPKVETPRRLKFALAISGFLAGAVFGVVLTRLRKIVSGAPPATVANYAWNAVVFGVLGGVVSPVVTWSEFRRAPLWRTVLEPLGYALAGGAAAVVVGSGMLLLALPPLGLALGYARLHHRYPAPATLPSNGPANSR